MKVIQEIFKWTLRICTLGLSLLGEKAVLREYMRQSSECRSCVSVDSCELKNKGYGCNQYKVLEGLK